MNGLHLKLRVQPPGDWDARSLTTELLRLTPRQAAALPLRRLGSQQVLPVGECFEVSQRSDGRVVIQGHLRHFHGIGSGWCEGQLVVEGDVGHGFAAQLAAGTVSLQGNAADGAASQMTGGQLRIRGDVGHDLGAPLPGRRSGIAGGRILVSGNCGRWAGYRMRRGTLIVLGDGGDWLGGEMVAGTIVLGGSAGIEPGAGMRRGTLILPAGTPLSPVRFSEAMPASIGFARLLAAELQAEIPQVASAIQRPLQRAWGDLSAGGRGEVWLYEQ